MGNRLYIGNLSFAETPQSLRDRFERYGDVADVHVVTDRDTGRSRGFAFVTMGTPEQARTCVDQTDGTMIDGRPVRVSIAEERVGRGAGARR
jgi:RNA recognition motif-containing protein